MLALLLAVTGYLGVGAGRQYWADRSFHPIKVPAATAAMPTARGVSGALAGKLQAGALGSQVAAQVIDANTGTSLFAQRTNQIVSPASTSKLLTAAAILTLRNATDRFTTKVVAGDTPGTVVLVGGGDPTLSAAPVGQPSSYPEAARITDLAAKVKASLAGTSVNQVLVDSSAFSGPTTAPGWAPEDAPSSYASPITATMVDGGRDTPGAAILSGTPDLAAGQALAGALAGAQVSRGTAPAGAKVLGQVSSAPVGRLVEQMLSESDNVIAEVLTRQVALAAKRPGSFADGAAAVSQALAPLGINVGSGMKDGSGLSVEDRIPASALAAVLVKAVDPNTPRLHPIVAGLSVAGWEGTLVEQARFTGPAANGDGVVRAKTGSLPANGVHTLAGLVTDADGRLLVFSFIADRAGPDSTSVRGALDQLAATLAGCGCR
jgi:D-alanyl-D-alanine carboxypeptidase/D-alanyl-D-alanine-endopeptidase (penicillin-binding protein 4)